MFCVIHKQGIKVQDNFCNEKTSKRENLKAM